MSILVTGGAGYIGSVVTEQLIADGEQVVVYDNLSQGHRGAVHPGAAFVRGDLADSGELDRVFREHRVHAVMHFASRTLVGESTAKPFLYLGDNVTNGLNLLRAAVRHNASRFILSSTANLFDRPGRIPISEEEQIIPGSPYGESKYLLERILSCLARTVGLRYAALRYFNAAGASESCGEDHRPETHLIPLVLQVALGGREHVEIYGTDYPTPDGTCIRDYIHVLDLAQAHILALRDSDRAAAVYNLGNGEGFSVRQVIDGVRDVTGRSVRSVEAPRRQGDPAVLIADSNRIRRELRWQPRFADLRTIIESAWRWYETHPYGYGEH